MFFSSDALNAMKNHAIAEYPKESCGLVINDAYFPCANYAVNPEKDFVIDRNEKANLEKKGEIQALVHSHPDGPAYPSDIDMQQQIAMSIPWAIIPTDGKQCLEPIIWGDSVPKEPLIGRRFRHGVHDCYSLIRDLFAIGRDNLKDQGIDWPYPPIQLDDFPRRDSWWSKDKETGAEADDLYIENFKSQGFYEISMEEMQPGDCFLKAIRSDRMNHAGALLSDGLILHHLPNKLSLRQPASLWVRGADKWLRHEAYDSLHR